MCEPARGRAVIPDRRVANGEYRERHVAFSASRNARPPGIPGCNQKENVGEVELTVEKT